MKCAKTGDELIVLDWDGVTMGEPTGGTCPRRQGTVINGMSIREIKEE